MSDDLFTYPPARARNTDPSTSHAAARKVTPSTDTIRAEVERWAMGRGPTGFIDEELSDAFDASEVSSYRTRRAELTMAGRIVAAGTKRPNKAMNQCTVWIHASFRGQTPPPDKPFTVREELLRRANQLDEFARQFRSEGRAGVDTELQATAALIRKAVGGTPERNNSSG